MLVLTRRPGQSIIIDNAIKLTLTKSERRGIGLTVDGKRLPPKRSGDTFKIREDISVTVADARQSMVRLGIEAPKDVPVNREEVQERIDAEADQK